MPPSLENIATLRAVANHGSADGRTSPSAVSMSSCVIILGSPEAMESMSAASVASSHRCVRSAPDRPSVRFASRATSMPAIGRSRSVARRICSRASVSGGDTRTVRSKRPGRRNATSTSHG
ncbi:hypothetical protein LX16_2420 [Stackebrandtia albiflava]|uniref:Uncharacterized protein n=1 Tax=Stackebrandtia albiflava TaxID=406432 RepID=A0A562V1J6_9ACTN|nr:hypothetical protein LX16_2420 [Stackebrandtia albiflava]